MTDAETNFPLGMEIEAGDAVFIRRLRVDAGCSWRGVASRCWEEFGQHRSDSRDSEFLGWGPLPGNQLAGMELCRRAAEHFGEDPNEKPWNG